MRQTSETPRYCVNQRQTLGIKKPVILVVFNYVQKRAQALEYLHSQFFELMLIGVYTYCALFEIA
jgi:hypothetical protein